MRKKLTAAIVVLAALAVVSGLVYAQTPAAGPTGQESVQALRQFQKETLPLRDELLAKRLELREEFAKQAPDENRIAQLQKQMIDLNAKIRASAEKNGIQAWGYGRGYGPRGGYGYGPRGYGYGCYGPGGNGYGWGGGPGYCRGGRW